MRLPFLFAAALGAPGLASADEVTVFAAASLTNAMAEIEVAFEEASPHTLTVALAGSSALARQIIAGAPADVFISANTAWMDEVEAAGLALAGTRRDLLGNTLVLIASGNAPRTEVGPDLDLPALLDGGRLAMALVDAVPAGIYGKAALQRLGLWDGVADRVVQTDNVRTALRLVAAGEAPYGITYATDAVPQYAVTVVGTFPEESHPPIVYPVAGLTNDAATAAFLTFLGAPEARAAFERQGFTLIDE